MGSVKKGFAMLMSSLPVAGLFFAYGTVTNFVNNAFAARIQNNTTSPLFGLSILVSIVFVVIGLYLQAGSMAYFRDKAKTGTSTLGALLSEGRRYFKPFFLFGILIMAIVGVAAGGAVAVIQAAPRAVGVAITATLVLVALYFVVIWFLTPYAIVVDQKGLKEAMGASVSVVKKNLLPIAGIALVLVVIGFVSGFVFGLISGFIGAVMNKGAVDPNNPVPPAVLTVFGSLVNAILGVLMTATYMDFYLKVTREHAASS